MQRSIIALLALVVILVSLAGLAAQPPAAADASPTPGQLTAGDFLLRGDAAFGEGRYEAAVDAYTSAIELEPGLATAYMKRGDAHANLGDDLAALADYDEAIELAPQLAETHARRGEVNYRLERNRAAIPASETRITTSASRAMIERCIGGL